MGSVYRFSFDVSPSDMLELDAPLGDCILHDPLRAVSLFQSVSCTNKIYKIPNLLVTSRLLIQNGIVIHFLPATVSLLVKKKQCHVLYCA